MERGWSPFSRGKATSSEARTGGEKEFVPAEPVREEAPEERLLVVGGALIEGGRVLLTQRQPGQSLAGCWEFPGGKVEPGETPEEALEREFQEELGVAIRVQALLGTGVGRAEGIWIELSVYCVERVGGEAPGSGVDPAVGWFDASEIGSLRWPEADRPLLPALLCLLDPAPNSGSSAALPQS